MKTEQEIRQQIQKEKQIFDTAVATRNYKIGYEQAKKIIILTKELYATKNVITSSDRKGLEILEKLVKKLEKKIKKR